MIRFPISHQLVALHDALHVGELPDVDHHPGHVAADEGDDDAEQHQEHVHLFPQLSVRPKPLWFHMAEVDNDPQVDEDEGQEGNDGGAEEPEVRPVEFDVVTVMSKFCCPVGRYTDHHFLIVHIIQLCPVQLKVVEFVLCVVQLVLGIPVGASGYFRVPVDFALQELGDVEDEAEEEDGQDVEPGLSVVGGKV